ncbi:MAG TPA: anti-sigma regulatory factor [Leptolyngbyaceae cyanobacterium]
MTQRLDLMDLQPSLLQHEAECINRERSQLVNPLQPIKNLVLKITKNNPIIQSFQLQVTTDLSALAQVLSWFDQLRQPSIPNTIWLGCKTALAEGFDNAVCHAHQQLPPETPIDIEVTFFTQSLEIRIWDSGSAFDFEAHLQQLPEEIDETAESGRGVKIMQQIADYLSYTRTPDNRNCLLIIKSYSS